MCILKCIKIYLGPHTCTRRQAQTHAHTHTQTHTHTHTHTHTQHTHTHAHTCAHTQVTDMGASMGSKPHTLTYTPKQHTQVHELGAVSGNSAEGMMANAPPWLLVEGLTPQEACTREESWCGVMQVCVCTCVCMLLCAYGERTQRLKQCSCVPHALVCACRCLWRVLCHMKPALIVSSRGMK